jgi:hypothetical protein
METENEIRSIGIGSVFKVILVLYLIIGLILGILAAIFGGFIASLMEAQGLEGLETSIFGGALGVIGGIMWGIVAGIVGGIFAAIGAALYNLVAKWVGGIRIILRE